MFKFIARLWLRLVNRAPKPRVSESTVADNKPQYPTSYKPLVVAIINGHSAKKPNAKAYNGTREYFWNDDVQEYIFAKYEGKIKLIQLDRPDWGYKRAMKWLAQQCHKHKVDVAIELHFDAAGVPKAKGGHFRTMKGNKEALAQAQDFMEGYLGRFNFASQRHNGVKEMKQSDAGYWFCYYMDKYGIAGMLFEPFFADYKTEESAPFLELDGHKLMAHYWIAELDKLEARLNL